MSEQLSDIVKKLNLIYPVAEIAEKTGYSRGNVSMFLANKREPTKAFLKKFYEVFDIKEELTKVEEPPASYIVERRNKKLVQEYTVPFYDAGATAGNDLTNTDNAITDAIGTISVGHFLSDAEAAIRIYGNSMMSNYPPGCILGISQLKERIIQPGEVYIVETEEQRIFKRLFYKDDDPDSNVVMCYSDNTMLFEGGARNGKLAYPPFYVPLKSIRKINVVLGVVKRNVNLLIK